MATATRTSARLPEAKNVGAALDRAMAAGKGILRLSPTWVPRSFLHPGKRVRLHPDDYYAYGLDRGGIDERWFASTTPTANEGRAWDEGLSYCVVGKQRFTLQQAVADTGALLVENPIPEMIAITGSVRAGMEVAKSAAMDVKRVHLELGGKAPVVIFADAFTKLLAAVAAQR